MIKCNQQINFQGKTKKENRFIKKTQHIYRKTGFLGFYRGFWVTVNRDIISTGLYFYFHNTIKDKLKLSFPDSFGAPMEVLAGGITGLITWTISYPFDTMKTILITTALKENVQTQWRVLKEMGWVKLYRGAAPAILLSISYTGLTFLFFEISKNFLF